MKSLGLLLLLLAPTQNQTVVQDSASTQVLILTTPTNVEVHDVNYAATPGHYFIGGIVGTVPFVNIKGGFTIADPKLAHAIDNGTSKVVFTFQSNITVNNLVLPISININALNQRAPKN